MNKKLIFIFILLIVQSQCNDCELDEDSCGSNSIDLDSGEQKPCCCNDTDEEDDDDSCDDSCDTEERETNTCGMTTTTRRTTTTTTRQTTTTTRRTSTTTTPKTMPCCCNDTDEEDDDDSCDDSCESEERESACGLTTTTILSTTSSRSTTRQTTTRPASSTTSLASTTVAPNPCEGIILGKAPNPSNCTTYYYCVFGIPSLGACDGALVFNPENLSCQPGNPETCEIFEVSTPETSTTSTSTTESNVCVDINFGRVPNPSDCTTFFHCELGRASLRACNESLVFDPESLTCLPGNSETCEIFQVTTITESTSSSTTEEPTTEPSTITTTEVTETTPSVSETSSTTEFPRFYCECPTDITQNGILIPSPYSCAQYYECIWGVAYRRDCPEGLYFDALTNTCVDPIDAHCGSAIQCVY